MSVIRNRIQKNDKKIRPWAERKKIEAYRLYDLDIPEYPFLLDRYQDEFVFYDRSVPSFERDKIRIEEAKGAIKEYFNLNSSQLIIKERKKQKGDDQYDKISEKGIFKVISEGPLHFNVNLHDYLDTGLFLDHRPLRERLVKISHNLEVLNLFCYTGSLSVAAAFGGSRVTSVDMSSTYLNWAEKNFLTNRLPLQNHRFLREDILQYLSRISEIDSSRYDLILLDPPTFSNSKKMLSIFEVEKDQDFLIQKCSELLKPNGLIIFSNNKKKFRLSKSILESFVCKDISKESTPLDFHQNIHSCYEIKKAGLTTR